MLINGQICAKKIQQQRFTAFLLKKLELKTPNTNTSLLLTHKVQQEKLLNTTSLLQNSEKTGFRQTSEHTQFVSCHQWLCSKFPFKGSPQDRLCVNIIQGPFEVCTWNVFWLGCGEWRFSPLGYWRGEALLGRLEEERQHLVVPSASPRHISHI